MSLNPVVNPLNEMIKEQQTKKLTNKGLKISKGMREKQAQIWEDVLRMVEKDRC